MNVGIIGAGRVGCSIGKFLAGGGQTVAGYYDKSPEMADSAARFVGTACFRELEKLVSQSGLLFITTPDGVITQAWEEIKGLALDQKIVCHCSGALSSNDAFPGIEDTGWIGCSIHPMLPFSNRFSSYEQLNHAFFTVEGQQEAAACVGGIFQSMGCQVCHIDGSCKAKYHAAASILSNQVVAVLDTGYRLLTECGFDRNAAVQATAQLVRQNVENVLEQDCVEALTGPIDRGDVGTVRKHLACLEPEDAQMYRVLGRRLLQIAQQKYPQRDDTLLSQALRDV